ncbi:MAG: thioredoxin domain-containing protein [bacterium]|nr:thioredoxin domain-containing protein [bacterium]
MPELKKFEITSPVAIIIAGVVIADAIVFAHMRPAAPAEAGAAVATVSATSVRPPSAQDHIVGSPTAPIVLVEYSDFQCPFCSMIHPTLKKIVGESGGKIAWVMRQFPLDSIHPQANPAANAAECIAAQLGNTGFWKFADAIFANQQSISPAYYAQLAQQFGADMPQYNACFAASKYQTVIDADVAEAQAAGASGTPYTIVLNTRTNKAAPVSGALPEAQIMAVIKSVQ